MRTTLTVRAPTLVTSLAVLLVSSACPPSSGPDSPAPRPLPQVSGAVLLDLPSAWEARGENDVATIIAGYQPTRATLEGATARFEGLARVGVLSIVTSCNEFGCSRSPVWSFDDRPLCVELSGDAARVETDCPVYSPEQDATTDWSATSSDGWPNAFTPGAQWLTAFSGAPPTTPPTEAWSFATRVAAIPSEYDDLWPSVAYLSNNRRFTRGSVTQPWSGREQPAASFWRFEDAVAGVGFALPDSSVRHLWGLHRNPVPTAQWLSHAGAVYELTEVDVNGTSERRVLDPLGDARVRPLAVAHDEATTVALLALDDEEDRAATAERLDESYRGQYKPHRHLRLALVRRGAPPGAASIGPAPEPMQAWATSERNVLLCLSTPVEQPAPGAITGLDGVEVTSVTGFRDVPHCLAVGVRGVTRGLGGAFALDGLVSPRGARSGRTRTSFLAPRRLEGVTTDFAYRPTATWSPLGNGAFWALYGLSLVRDLGRGVAEVQPFSGSPVHGTGFFASFTGHAWLQANLGLHVVTRDGVRAVGDANTLAGGEVSSFVHLGDGSLLARTNIRSYQRIFPDGRSEPFPLPAEATTVHGSFVEEPALLVGVDGGSARLGPGGTLGPERFPPLGRDHVGDAALFRVGATLYRCDAHLYRATPPMVDGGVGGWELVAAEACLAWGVSRGADGTVWLGGRAVREHDVTEYHWPMEDPWKHVLVDGDDVTFHEQVSNLGLKGSYLRAPLRELLEVGDGTP